jgi:hypothetical protein
MKTKLKLHVLFLAMLCASNFARGQGTAFTYQGRLNDNGVPANGNHDLQFTIFDADNGGLQVLDPLTNSAVGVSNGLFTVALDFGAGIFDGSARWLEISVRTNATDAFTTLRPRQALTATPYAIYAGTSAKVVSGSVVTSLNGLKDDVTLAAGNNVTLTPNGNMLTIDAANGGGSSIWSQLNGNAYYTAGKVGIGTTTPLAPLEVNGILRSTRGGLAIQYVQLDGGDPAGIRLTAQSAVAAEKPLMIQNLSGESVPGANNSMQFVLGTTAAPSSKMTLTKDGDLILPLTGLGGAIQFGTPNTESGMSIVGANRADIRFDGTTLKLLANAGTGIPAFGNGITINTSGKVGIGGSLDPVSKLEVVGQDALGLIGFQPFLTLYDSSAGYTGSRIQNVSGEMILEPQSYLSGSDGNAYAKLFNSGNFSVKSLTIRGGADLAEPFELSGNDIAKGSVMVIDDEHTGRLKLSDQAYDTRVAGIVSGANGINAGISLQQEGRLEGGQNVALSGRVYVQADAAFGAIKPGDMLTTSTTPGHAMKVTNCTKGQGAILGKAMSGLKEGRGMVLVLVTLQ